MNIPEEGLYYLISEEGEKTLVEGYRCTDMDGQFVFGFNTIDGGGVIPLFDLSEKSQIISAIVSDGDIFER